MQTESYFGTDDLSLPYKPKRLTEKSKFSPRIALATLPAKSKLPNTVGKYDGLSDPDDHILAFTTAGRVGAWTLPAWCHLFAQTLTGAARAWFDSIPVKRIDDFQELEDMFLQHFSQQRRHNIDPANIL